MFVCLSNVYLLSLLPKWRIKIYIYIYIYIIRSIVTFCILYALCDFDTVPQIDMEGAEKWQLMSLSDVSGNNTFGEAVRDELLKLKGSTERSSFVLMKRIHPVVFRNYPVAADHPVELREMVSELGVYGSLVA